jgi:pantoate--beta-alanine ligase
MQVVSTLAEWRAARAALSGGWGLVATHGRLHAGQLSLVARARAECERVVVARWPAASGDEPERDLSGLEPLGVDVVWAPTAGNLFPLDYQSWVMVAHVAAPLEGKHRPGHFQRVATETVRLFNAVAPSRAYYGQIDGQQLAVVRRLTLDLAYDVEIVACPTVREPDGLAISERNADLSQPERQAAPVLYRALAAAERAYGAGEREGDTLRAILSSTLASEPLAREEYVSVAQAESLDELEQVTHGALLSLAAKVGKVRLLDCLALD